MNRLIKRVLIILLAILVAIQVPFVYRRYKIGQLAGKVAELNAQRIAPPEASRFKEYKGVIHVHSSLGGHSTGTFDELIAAANANDLDFVIMTEHWSDAYDTAALTLNGVYGKTLFIGGNEIDTADGDRFLMIPGSADAAGLRKMSTAAVIEKLHSEARLAFVTYPERFRSWDSGFDGIEVFSLHTNARRADPFSAFFDVVWSYRAYPELLLATYLRRPGDELARFDTVAARRDISLIAGTDAHSNIGFHLFGDETGKRLAAFKLDKYAVVFGVMRQHVLIDADTPFDPETLLAAIRSGRSFVGFDVFADSSGFRFFADDTDPQILRAFSPNAARFVVYKDGEIARQEGPAREILFRAEGPGAYRVEVYLDGLGEPFDKMPWIISNPIYVR